MQDLQGEGGGGDHESWSFRTRSILSIHYESYSKKKTFFANENDSANILALAEMQQKYNENAAKMQFYWF